MIIKESLSPSEALYGFGSWLTTRKEPITISSHHNAGIVSELIDEFIKKQELEKPKDHWEDELVPMNEELLDDILTPKSEEDIIKELSKLTQEELNLQLRKFSYKGLLNNVKLLIKAGADVNSKSDHGWTSLTLASSHGHNEIIKELIDNGADIYITTFGGNTPLMIAKNYRYPNTEKLLKQYYNK